MERKLPKWARLYFSLLGAVAVLALVAVTVWFARAALAPRKPSPPTC